MDVIHSCFVPNVVVVASADCEEVYTVLRNVPQPLDGEHPLRAVSLPEMTAKPESIDIEALVREVHSQNESSRADQEQLLTRLAAETTVGSHAQGFETFGHPLACILTVSSANANPISALTQLYQLSYTEIPQHISADALRVVLFVQLPDGDENSHEDFETVRAQFGPYCYKIDGFNALKSGLTTVAEDSVYPYCHRLMKAWKSAETKKNNAFGKFLKRLVHSGPPRPEVNVFSDVCKDMQPHVASIPAKRRALDVDMQLRRLADVAFMLHDVSLAQQAYAALRKSFSSEQRWAQLGGAGEMSAVCLSLLRAPPNDVIQAIDTALYTYRSRIHLDAHALRAALLTSFCLTVTGDQLLAADILSSTLMDTNPVLGSGDLPAETAMLMEQLALTYQQRGWLRKEKLWTKLATEEWAGRTNDGESE